MPGAGRYLLELRYGCLKIALGQSGVRGHRGHSCGGLF
jgi:hypothetical protein